MAGKRRYARGKKARAICERHGGEIPYKYLIVEPGTGYLIDKRWSDKEYNAVDHPRNFPPLNLCDEAPLRNATGETDGEKLTTKGTLFEVSLPNGMGLEVEEVYPSVTVVNILGENGQLLFDETSVTITGVFNRGFWLSYRYIA